MKVLRQIRETKGLVDSLFLDDVQLPFVVTRIARLKVVRLLLILAYGIHMRLSNTEGNIASLDMCRATHSRDVEVAWDICET